MFFSASLRNGLMLSIPLSLLPAVAPAAQVALHAGDDVAAIVEQSPAGTEFRFQAGTYRLQSIVPKPGDSFVGEPQAILNGARLLTQFSRSGRFWTAPVQV